MNQHICKVGLVAGAIALLTAPALADKPKKLNRTDLPPAILVTFESNYPKAEIKSISKEVRDSTIYYEIDMKNGGTPQSLLYTIHGTVYEIEEEVGVKSVPDSVTAPIRAKGSKSKIVKAERITRGKVIEYELLVQTKDGQTEYVIDSQGKILSTEPVMKKAVDDEEDDDDDGK